MVVWPSNLIVEALKATPAAHDEGVIGSYHGDDINTLCLEFIDLLEVRGEVICVASRLVYMLSAPELARQARKLRTVKAPGTDTMTTFFPFHASVLKEVAVSFRASS